MLKSLLRDRCRAIGIYAWYSLIFLQPFNQFGALRILSMAVLLICLAVDLACTRPGWCQRPALRVALLIAVWAIAVSLLGPYPLDSFQALRKDLLVQALMLTAALTYVRTKGDAWRVIGVALAGFGAVTLLSLVEIANYWVHNGFSLWVERTHASYWGGYANSGGFYAPLLVGYLLCASRPRTLAIFGWTGFAASLVLVFLYGSRTPLLVIIIAITVLLVMLKHLRRLILPGLLVLCLIGLFQTAQLGRLDHYKSLLKSATYVTDSGLSSRLSVWEGCWQVIGERPLVGYGYGWKKLAWAINDADFAERWQSRPDITRYYLQDGKASYGRVNPHNYALQVMFEIGLIGLALVVAFWLTTLREVLVLRHSANQELREIAACLITALIAYALANLTNGYWVGGLANLSLAFAGCLLALTRIDAARNRPD